MNDSAPSTNRRLSGQPTLMRLAAMYCAAIVALVGAIWFAAPDSLSSVLFIAALVFAVLTAICAGRTVAHSQASIDYLDRSSISGRGTGALTLAALSLVAIACAKFVYPQSWPTSVEEAVASLAAQLDAPSKRDLAYMAYDDLMGIQDRLGAEIREQFGLDRRNDRLLHDCDPEYIDPHSCSSIIISRLWKKLRADLPQTERESLEALEDRMERVRLSSEHFQDAPLEKLVAFFNDAIRAQLPDDARFRIIHDPAQAQERVSTSWQIMGTISLREALGMLTAKGQWRVRKKPPNLILERT